MFILFITDNVVLKQYHKILKLFQLLYQQNVSRMNKIILFEVWNLWMSWNSLFNYSEF